MRAGAPAAGALVKQAWAKEKVRRPVTLSESPLAEKPATPEGERGHGDLPATPAEALEIVEDKPGFPILVAGARRLVAAKKLGWEWVECFVHVNMTDDEARVLEITENLERQDLTAAERKKWAKELLTLFGKIEEAETATNDAVSSKGGRGKKGASDKVAKTTGLSKRTVQRLQKDMQKNGELPAPDIPGHNSSKDVAAKREAARVESLTQSRAPRNEVEAAGLVNEGNTEDGYSEEGTEASSYAAFTASPASAAPLR